MYICTCKTYIHLHICAYIHTYIHIHICTCKTCIHIHIYAYIHTYIHTCIHTYVYIYILKKKIGLLAVSRKCRGR